MSEQEKRADNMAKACKHVRKKLGYPEGETGRAWVGHQPELEGAAFREAEKMFGVDATNVVKIITIGIK